MNSVTGRPIAGANVIYSPAPRQQPGRRVHPATPPATTTCRCFRPGFYQIRVTAPAYQSQEVQELELTVAARIELDFRLRPLSDVWESGRI